MSDDTGAQDALVDLGRKLKEVVPKPAARAPAAPAAPFEEASGAQVVISPTAKFNKLPSAAPDDDHPADGGTGKVGIVGQDGKLDIGASIRSKAKTVRASELAARHDRVRVLNMNTIKGLIQEAVAEAMQHIGASIGETERKRLLEEAEANFQEKLKAFQAEKSGSEEKAKRLQDQLRMAQDLLEQERKRTVSKDQFTVSAAGMGEIEERLRRVLDHAIATGNVSPELEAKLREMIAHILDTERERIKAQELEAQNAQIDLLQKKIQRLAGSLEETERQRNEAQQLAAALEAQGGGLRGVMVAGINDSDAQKKRKLALMKEILDINRRMREELGVDYVRDDAAVAKIQAEMAKLPDFVKSSEPVAPVPTNSAAELATAAAERGETAADADADAEDENAPIINPDDEPWEVKPIQVKSDAERDEAKLGVKRINVGAKAPPPLEKKQASASTKSAGDTAVTDSSAAVDPDDQAWEVQPMQTQAPGAVKKINVAAKEPPPLERKSKPGT
ncbi:MAG: hypothetical protein H0W72_13550 [Planctomycetes bacterium]|nr:hypothetical protein [Planctomycetota bacterium]